MTHVPRSRIRTVAVFLASLMTVTAVVAGPVPVATATGSPIDQSAATPSPADPSAETAGVILQATPTVSVTDGTVDVGNTTRLDVTLSEAPRGLTGYEINLTIQDGTLANFTGATYPPSFALNRTTVAGGGSRITLKAADLGNATVPGDTNVPLATVDVAGLDTGQTNVTVDVVKMDPDGPGDPIEPATRSGVLTVRGAPDVSVAVSRPSFEQRLQDGVVADVSVTNEKSFPVEDVTARLNASGIYLTKRGEFTTRRFTVDLNASETKTVRVDLTTWAVENLTPRFYDQGRIALAASVDPADEIAETDETNNRAVRETVATYSDLAPSTYTYYRGVVNESHRVTVWVRNRGTAPTTENHTVRVEFGDGTTESFEVRPIPRFRSVRRSLEHTYTRTGTYRVNATVLGDTLGPYAGNNRSSDRVEIEQFRFAVTSVTAPRRVDNGSQFRVWVSYYTNVPTDVNLTLELPAEGLELAADVPDNTATKTDRSGSWGGGEVWTLNATKASDGGRFRINVSGSARGETDNASNTVEVVVPKIRVTDQAVVRLDNATNSGTANLTVRNETTFEHEVTVSVQAGSEGRTLKGLQYLFGYPYGCVEQTTSPMLAALSTDQYYRHPDRTPGPNYERDETNKSIAIGMERLSNGALAQHDNGSWSMWGRNPRGDVFYAMYAYFGATSVRNDPIQSANTDTSGVQTVPASLAAIDVNATVDWIHGEQQPSGAIDEGRGYFLETDAAMTGFALVTIDQAEQGGLNASAAATAADIREDGARYLVNQQASSGAWGGDHTKTTAIIVWGLQTVKESGDVSNATLRSQINDSIDRGTAWLLDQQEADGGFPFESNPYWSNNQRRSSATAWTLLALNETGIPADNTSIRNGVLFLVSVYDADGSFGGTESTGLAVRALNELGQGIVSGSRTITVDIDDDDGTITKQVEVNASSDLVEVSLSPAELAQLQDGPITKAVDVSSTGDGPAIVALSNEQVVNRNEYEATQRRLGLASARAADGGLSVLSHGGAHDDEFGVALSVPDEFTTGDNQTLSVTVTNHNATATFLNPIVEIPLTGDFDASRPLSATTTVDGTVESRTIEVQESTLTDGEAIFVFGREVPPGESRTYDVNISVGSPGEVTVLADTRPLYNESLNVNVTGTFTASGLGTLNVEVVHRNGTPVPAATVDVAGSETAIGPASHRSILAAGTYRVSARTGSTTFPSVNVTLDAFETANVTFVVPPADLSDPAVVVRTADGVAIPPGTIDRETVLEANATTDEVVRLAFNVTTPPGANTTAVVSVDESVERAFRVNRDRTVAVSAAGPTAEVLADDVGRDGNATTLSLRGDGELSVEVTYTGYKLGDATLDDRVTAADARAIAEDRARGDPTAEYGDASGDGAIDVVDAMFVAQRASDNRDADYGAATTSAFAATGATISVESPSAVTQAGPFQSELVAENVAPGDDLGAFEVTITYDPTDVDAENVTVEAGNATNFTVASHSPAEGTLRIVGYTDELDTPAGTLTLAEITIDGSRTVTTANVSVSVERLTDTDGVDVPVAAPPGFTTCIPDAVAGGDGTISLSEIQLAINWWAEDTPVPDTGGRTTSLAQIQSLINDWATDASVAC